MKLYRVITEPIRSNTGWDGRWDGADQGLIACWERGRMKSQEDAELTSRIREGQLVILPWKGGVEKAIKTKKYGTLKYLAMWQGLRGEDLNIDTEKETVLTCSVTGMKVIFTNDHTKFALP